MLRVLKFGGFLLINVIVAIMGTAIVEAPVHKAIRSHSVAGVVRKEIVLSIVCAALVGFGMWRSWRNSAAKWTWVLPAAWFSFGYLMLLRQGNVWGQLTGSGSGSVLIAPDIKNFFFFTVPLVRAVFYSFGVYLSSLRYSAPTVPT